MRPWLLIAAINGFVAVGAGAYGHHAPMVVESNFRASYNLGVTYQMWHALALLGVDQLSNQGKKGWLVNIAGGAFTAGIFLFSGTLYVLGVTEVLLFRHAAPVGGVLFLIGWAALIGAALKKPA